MGDLIVTIFYIQIPGRNQQVLTKLFILAICSLPRALIDERCHVGGAEAIVDVDHADVRRAGVQHAEKSGESVERGSVADAGGNRDDGNSHESTNHRGQSAFHAGTDDDDARFREHAAMGKKAMDARHSDVVKRLDVVAHEFGSDDGFLGDGNVAGSGGDDGDGALRASLTPLGAVSAARGVVATQCDAAGERTIFGLWNLCRNGAELLFGGAGGEDIALGMMRGEVREDLGDLCGSFALAEDDFGHSVAQGAMVVELGKAEVFEGKMAKALDGFIRRELFRTHFLEEFVEGISIHAHGYSRVNCRLQRSDCRFSET